MYQSGITAVRDPASTHTALVKTKHPPAKLPPTIAQPIPCIYRSRASSVRSNILSIRASTISRTPRHFAQIVFNAFITGFVPLFRDRPPDVIGGREASNSAPPAGERDSRDLRRRLRRWVTSYVKKMKNVTKKNHASQLGRDHSSDRLPTTCQK